MPSTVCETTSDFLLQDYRMKFEDRRLMFGAGSGRGQVPIGESNSFLVHRLDWRRSQNWIPYFDFAGRAGEVAARRGPTCHSELRACPQLWLCILVRYATGTGIAQTCGEVVLGWTFIRCVARLWCRRGERFVASLVPSRPRRRRKFLRDLLAGAGAHRSS